MNDLLSSLRPGGKTLGRAMLVGMVHLPPLPGSPRFSGSRSALRDLALKDATALAEGGADALMIENFWDVPFFRGRVPAATTAEITHVAAEVKRAVGEVPIGINVLRNDGQTALAVASAVGGSFVRVNVLCGARVTDQGVIEGIAADLMRDRVALHAERVRVWADVDVKHSAPLGVRDLDDEVGDTLVRGLADALIVSGAGTGRPTDPGKLARVKALAGPVPVLVGSGVNVRTAHAFAGHADGLIVGTALKKDGRPDAPVDVARVRELVAAMK